MNILKVNLTVKMTARHSPAKAEEHKVSPAPEFLLLFRTVE